MNNVNFEREFDWNDEIKEDGGEFVLLPEGDYIFTVENFERARHEPQPGGKLPACNKAIIHILIQSAEGEARLRHNLFLHSSTEGMLSAFFGAIGLKKRGEPLRMNWNIIAGRQGVCHIGIREYNGNKYNDVKRMIYADDVDMTKVLNANMQQAPVNAAPVQQPTAPAPSQAPAQPTYQQNSFSWQPAGTEIPFN